MEDQAEVNRRAFVDYLKTYPAGAQKLMSEITAVAAGGGPDYGATLRLAAQQVRESIPNQQLPAPLRMAAAAVMAPRLMPVNYSRALGESFEGKINGNGSVDGATGKNLRSSQTLTIALAPAVERQAKICGTAVAGKNLRRSIEPLTRRLWPGAERMVAWIARYANAMTAWAAQPGCRVTAFAEGIAAYAIDPDVLAAIGFPKAEEQRLTKGMLQRAAEWYSWYVRLATAAEQGIDDDTLADDPSYHRMWAVVAWASHHDAPRRTMRAFVLDAGELDGYVFDPRADYARAVSVADGAEHASGRSDPWTWGATLVGEVGYRVTTCEGIRTAIKAADAAGMYWLTHNDCAACKKQRGAGRNLSTQSEHNKLVQALVQSITAAIPNASSIALDDGDEKAAKMSSIAVLGGTAAFRGVERGVDFARDPRAAQARGPATEPARLSAHVNGASVAPVVSWLATRVLFELYVGRLHLLAPDAVRKFGFLRSGVSISASRIPDISLARAVSASPRGAALFLTSDGSGFTPAGIAFVQLLFSLAVRDALTRDVAELVNRSCNRKAHWVPADVLETVSCCGSSGCSCKLDVQFSQLSAQLPRPAEWAATAKKQHAAASVEEALRLHGSAGLPKYSAAMPRDVINPGYDFGAPNALLKFVPATVGVVAPGFISSGDDVLAVLNLFGGDSVDIEEAFLTIAAMHHSASLMEMVYNHSRKKMSYQPVQGQTVYIQAVARRGIRACAPGVINSLASAPPVSSAQGALTAAAITMAVAIDEGLSEQVAVRCARAHARIVAPGMRLPDYTVANVRQMAGQLPTSELTAVLEVVRGKSASSALRLHRNATDWSIDEILAPVSGLQARLSAGVLCPKQEKGASRWLRAGMNAARPADDPMYIAVAGVTPAALVDVEPDASLGRLMPASVRKNACCAPGSGAVIPLRVFDKPSPGLVRFDAARAVTLRYRPHIHMKPIGIQIDNDSCVTSVDAEGKHATIYDVAMSGATSVRCSFAIAAGSHSYHAKLLHGVARPRDAERISAALDSGTMPTHIDRTPHAQGIAVVEGVRINSEPDWIACSSIFGGYAPGDYWSGGWRLRMGRAFVRGLQVTAVVESNAVIPPAVVVDPVSGDVEQVERGEAIRDFYMSVLPQNAAIRSLHISRETPGDARLHGPGSVGRVASECWSSAASEAVRLERNRFSVSAPSAAINEVIRAGANDAHAAAALIALSRRGTKGWSSIQCTRTGGQVLVNIETDPAAQCFTREDLRAAAVIALLATDTSKV